jgi:hypothetical protein
MSKGDGMKRQLVSLLGCLMFVGCSSKPQFDEGASLKGQDALNCVAVTQPLRQQCQGRSVILAGFTIANAPMGYRLSVENPDNGQDPGDSDDFIAVYDEDIKQLEGKVRIKGTVQSTGFFAPRPVVLIADTAPAKLTRREAELLAQRQRDGYKSPEDRIVEAREEGAKALEGWDAAIRKNNQDVQRELSAHAVSHNTRVSDHLRVDVYGMPDGRLVACKTEIYPQGAPITTCDGAP